MSELVKAVKNKKYAEAEQLILNGADPNEEGEDGVSVLWWAVYKAATNTEGDSSPNINLIKLLISKGANLNVNKVDYSPLIVALVHFHRAQHPKVLKIVKILLDMIYLSEFQNML